MYIWDGVEVVNEATYIKHNGQRQGGTRFKTKL